MPTRSKDSPSPIRGTHTPNVRDLREWADRTYPGLILRWNSDIHVGTGYNHSAGTVNLLLESLYVSHQALQVQPAPPVPLSG